VVGIMWSTGPEATAELEVGVPAVTISDVMGNRRQVKTTNGIALIKLSPMPQYLLGAKSIRPASTVKLEMRQATLDPSRPRVAVTLTNNRTEELNGTLVLSPESALTLTPASYLVAHLRQGETRTYYIDVTPQTPMRDARLSLRARLRTATRTYEAADALNFQAAPAASPVIDGDLAEWALASPLVVNRADQFRIMSGTKAWGGPSDISGKMYLAWDAKNLYVAARVTDDTYAPASTPGGEFNFDSIELLVDVTRGLRKEAPFQMVTLSDFQDHPRVRRYDGPMPKGDVSSAKIAVKRTGAETVYEAAIPWSDLAMGFTPKLGQTISVAFTIDDHDGGDSGRRGMSWFSTVTDKNATEFGDITLTGPAQPFVNLLRNGDFEDRTALPGEKMEGWNFSWAQDEGPRNAECSLTSEGAYQGRSLKITRLTPKSNMSIGGWTVPVQPGQVYLFRALTKLPERAMLTWLRPLDAKGKELPTLVDPQAISPATTFVYGRGLSLTVASLGDRDAYHPMEGIFEIPDGATALSIAFAYSWASGSAYIDNCELYLLRESPKP
jgi:hypothetical protein